MCSLGAVATKFRRAKISQVSQTEATARTPNCCCKEQIASLPSWEQVWPKPQVLTASKNLPEIPALRASVSGPVEVTQATSEIN